MIDDEIRYISFSDALNVYHRMVVTSGGGLEGIRDEGGIRACLDFVQNDVYYPTFADKLAHLVYGLCSGHYFCDGNKRIAITLGAYFLYLNKHEWAACNFMRQMEAFIYHVAASRINKVLFQRIIEAYLSGNDYDEELKIDIANAIRSNELDIDGEDYELTGKNWWQGTRTTNCYARPRKRRAMSSTR